MLTNEHIAKVMILYSLKQAACPLPIDVLSQIVSQCGFGAIGALSELNGLSEQNHVNIIEDDGVEYVVLTHSGEEICDNLATDLSPSLREKLMITTAREVAKLRKDLGVFSKSEEVDGGFKLYFELNDDSTNLMHLEMFAPTKAQADIMIMNFREDPYAVYKSALQSLTNPRK